MTQPQSRQTLQPIDLPPLPDEAAVALIEVLRELLFQFEGHYFGQLCRYHAEHAAEHHRRQPDLFDDAPDFDDPLLF
ncbi:hypothetical protein [Thiocapsa marina]|jgi:hypothetical protein|uniref:Uncharacterized protein n=1 Tax=Thiocapsa marina 5811 TaxID=768671 RepID=F9U9M0_9GAMM|nr:hypothetical protein [Thiocapsa marina]EGV18818.1 hypothetical protein ThimaDRAFT_1622 [Thiocapsa marina 5811]